MQRQRQAWFDFTAIGAAVVAIGAVGVVGVTALLVGPRDVTGHLVEMGLGLVAVVAMVALLASRATSRNFARRAELARDAERLEQAMVQMVKRAR